MFPDENPLGKQLLFGVDNGNGLMAEVSSAWWAMFDRATWRERTTSSFTWPALQRSFSFFNLVVRTSVNPEAATPMVRAALDKIDKEIPILQPNTLDTTINQSLGQRRLTMGLLGAFAGIALLLAVVGIYGVVAYTVEQRTAEIGVRIALGAQVKDVLNLVVRQGMNPVLIGLGFGLVGIFGTGRFLAAQLYQISPHNPILLALTATVLAIAALLACLIPARRAMSIDPIQALRSE